MPELEPPKEQKVEANVVAFDWGNTLIMDPFPSISKSISPQIAILIRQVTSSTPMYSELIYETWAQVNNDLNFPFASHFAQEDVFVQETLRRLGLPEKEIPTLSPTILSLYRREFRRRLEDDTDLQNELRKTFEGLHSKSKKIAILSNDRKSTPRSTLGWLGVEHLVDVYMTSEELGIEKPHRDFFTTTAQRVGFKLEDMVYVGDDPIRDVDGAHKSGVKAILFIPEKKHKSSTSWRDYSIKPQQEPEATIHKLSELVNIIV